MAVLEAFVPALQAMLDDAERSGKKALDPRPFMNQVKREHGLVGLRMALDLLTGSNEDLYRSPWGGVRRVEWTDQVALEELFKSESLETQYGHFLDQRFVDYLSRNFPEVDDINWRKFEALAGEFFAREGYDVQMGPGRDDGGVDVRVWPRRSSSSVAPAILVQCKRQRKKIEKAVVKALYADVLDEKAKSGLIVTTSELSPGSRAVITARAYPVGEANRETLRSWIEDMKTPGAGAFLAT